MQLVCQNCRPSPPSLRPAAFYIDFLWILIQQIGAPCAGSLCLGIHSTRTKLTIMNILKNLRLLALLSLIGLSACQLSAPAPDDSLLFIPEEASMVTAVRPAQLMAKADFQAIRQSEGYQEMLREAREANPVLAGVMEEPEKSGIALDKNMYFTMELRGEQKPFAAISMSIADAQAFEALLQSIDVDIQPAGNGYRFAGKPGESALAWNDKVAIIGFAKDQTDARAELERYLKTEPKASVASNKNLRRALAGDFDIANWISSDLFLQSGMAKNSAFLLNYDAKTLSGNYIQHFLTFEQGRVHSRSAFHFKKRIANDLGMMFHDKVKTDFAAAAPQGTPLFLMAAALDVEGINQLLIEKYSKGLSESALKQYGISTNTLLEALQGDILLAAYTPEGESEKPAMLFAAKVGEEKALNTLLDAAIKEKQIEKAGENRYQLLEIKKQESEKDSAAASPPLDIKGQALVHKGLLFISNNPALLDKVQKGEVGLDGQIATQANQLIGKHIFTALGDFKALGKHMDSDAIEAVEATAHRKGADVLLYMKNKDSNSLKYLIETMKKEAEREAPAPAGESEI